MSIARTFRGAIADVDIRLLRVFYVIVECNGVSAASIEMNVDRSTISKHLSDLETRLGLRLCERGRSGFSLTPEGRAIHQASRDLFGSLDLFGARVSTVHKRLTGNFHIAFADGCLKNPEADLPEVIRRFGEASADVHLILAVSSANEIERGVLEGRYQVGIVPYHHQVDGLAYDHVFTEDARLYCGSGHPLFDRPADQVTLHDIAAAAYVGWGYRFDKTRVDARLEFDTRATVYNNEAAAALILSGGFIGFLPVHYARQWEEADRMRALVPDIANYRKPIAAIAKQGSDETLMVQSLLEILRRVHGERRRAAGQPAAISAIS